MSPIAVFLIALFAGLFMYGRTLGRVGRRQSRGRAVDELMELAERLPEGVSMSAVVENSVFRLSEADKNAPYLVRKDSGETLTADDLDCDPRVFIAKEALADETFLERLIKPELKELEQANTLEATVELLEEFRDNEWLSGFRLRTGAVRQVGVQGSYARAWAYLEVLEFLDGHKNRARCRFLLKGLGSLGDFAQEVPIDTADRGLRQRCDVCDRPYSAIGALPRDQAIASPAFSSSGSFAGTSTARSSSKVSLSSSTSCEFSRTRRAIVAASVSSTSSVPLD